MRPSLLFLLALVACAPADGGDGDAPADSTAGGPAPADTTTAEARAFDAGLNGTQARQLTELDAPVVVPVLPTGWSLSALDAGVEGDEFDSYPHYSLAYHGEDGACFTLEAASGGIGDVFLTEPPHVREVAVPGIAGYGPVPLGYAEEGEEVEGWDPPEVQSEWFGADGMFFNIGSSGEDSCVPLGPDEAAEILGSLRYLDPADDVLNIGPLQPLETMEEEFDPADFTRPEPEAAVQAMLTGAGEVGEERVETLRQRTAHAFVLVTRLGLSDDSIRDERLRVVVTRRGDGSWMPGMIGRQQRCHEGRGQSDWGAELCQ